MENLSRLLSFQIVDIDGVQRRRKVKKLFRRNTNDVCKFCNKNGHLIKFCPSLPTEPQEGKSIFAEHLLSTPKIKLKIYENLDRKEVFQRVCKLGQVLNQGNPWLEDTFPFSALRKQLGFWKAIGADKSVLSWLAYGYQFRFAKPVQRKFFKNAKNTMEFEEFIDKEIQTHVGDGSFVEISKEEARVVNPFIISVNSTGKPRRCDDMRYVNAFLASPFFKMQTLERDIPNVVRPGDHMITRDLEKAYYKIPVADSCTKFQCFYWKGKYYKARVLLFGFCQAPFVLGDCQVLWGLVNPCHEFC